MNITNGSLEWHSVLDAVLNIDLRAKLSALDQSGVVAYTDGACLKNPGGPAGWSALLWAAPDMVNGQVREGAACFECYGHIPKSSTTTNNRAEISAVLAVLSLAPPALPLTIYSDSEYTIKVAQGIYQMKANGDLWELYRKLLSYRKQPPTFEWVRGHSGHLHNERADELAGLGAFGGDHASYEKWQQSQAPEARNSSQTPALSASPELRQQVQKLSAFFGTPGGSRASDQERKFIQDMAKRLQKQNFAPSDKQAAWVKGLVTKYRV